MDDEFPVGKIFGQSGFDEAMEGLTLFTDYPEEGQKKYQGGPDPKYTDSVYEEDGLNEGKKILINTFNRYL